MKKLFIILLLFVFNCQCYGAADTSRLMHYNIDNGFCSNNVYSVIQDKYGYLWFATDNGVVKYNGYSFKIFNTSDGLPSNDIWKLYADNQGRIWVHCHSNEIGYIQDDKYVILIKERLAVSINKIFEYNDNVFFSYNAFDLRKIGLLDKKGSLYIYTFDFRLLYLSEYKNVIEYIASSLKDEKQVNFYNYNLFSRNTEIVRKGCISAQDMHFMYDRMLTISNDDFVYFFKSNENKICILNKKTGALYLKDFSDFGCNKDEKVYTFLEGTKIIELITDKNIYTFDKYFKYINRKSISEILYNRQITWTLTDSFYNIWYTTNTNGVWSDLNISKALTRNKETEKLYNTKLIGSYNDINTYWWDVQTRTLYEMDSVFNIKTIDVPDHEIVKDVSYCNDSELYIVTNTCVYCYNKFHRIFRKLPDIYKILEGYNLKFSFNPFLGYGIVTNPDIVKSHFRYNWKIYQLAANKIVSINPYDVRYWETHDSVIVCDIIFEDRYPDFMLDQKNNYFFLYNSNKVAFFNYKTKLKLTFPQFTLSCLGINSIVSIKNDKHSNVIVACDDNTIRCFDIFKRRSNTYSCNFRLADTKMVIHDSLLIIAGKFGIAYTEIGQDLKLGAFRIIPNSKLFYYNFLYNFTITSSGTGYLNTDKGIYNFSMDSLRKADITPATDKFNLKLTVPFQRNISLYDTLYFPNNTQKFGLDILNFVGLGNVLYKYIIVGGSGKWERTTTGEIFLGDLKPGKYYQVKCMVNDGVWVSDEKSFYVYIMPLWWQTGRAQTIFWITGVAFSLLFILSLIVLTRYLVARANNKKRLLTELELRAVYAQINPHFIFNTLSAALYFIDKKRFQDAHLHVSKFSTLLRSYLKSSQERYIILSDEIEMLRNYIELQKTRFENKLNYRIEIDNKLPVKNISIPSLLLQPLIENAINHGLFHREDDSGLLILRFEQGVDHTELICTIDDNGIGRERSKELKKGSMVKESYGTKLTEQLISIFKEYEKVAIFLTYIDKKYPETGTIVKLTIRNIHYVA